MRKYKLYEVEIINDIPMLDYICEKLARNIADAEFQLKGDMETDKEYFITMSKS